MRWRYTNKYNITTAIKHAIEKKQEMKLEYQEKIKYSEELQERFLTNLSEYKDSKDFQEYKASISECIDYYSGLLSKKRKSKKLFKKHYHSIYWVRNTSSKLYFLRFIKVFILNI